MKSDLINRLLMIGAILFGAYTLGQFPPYSLHWTAALLVILISSWRFGVFDGVDQMELATLRWIKRHHGGYRG